MARQARRDDLSRASLLARRDHARAVQVLEGARAPDPARAGGGGDWRQTRARGLVREKPEVLFCQVDARDRRTERGARGYCAGGESETTRARAPRVVRGSRAVAVARSSRRRRRGADHASFEDFVLRQVARRVSRAATPTRDYAPHWFAHSKQGVVRRVDGMARERGSRSPRKGDARPHRFARAQPHPSRCVREMVRKRVEGLERTRQAPRDRRETDARLSHAVLTRVARLRFGTNAVRGIVQESIVPHFDASSGWRLCEMARFRGRNNSAP